jgi:hypothetical protein
MPATNYPIRARFFTGRTSYKCEAHFISGYWVNESKMIAHLEKLHGATPETARAATKRSRNGHERRSD